MREQLFQKATQLLEQLGGGERRVSELLQGDMSTNNTHQLYQLNGGGNVTPPKNSTDYDFYKMYKKYKRKYKQLIMTGPRSQ